MSDIQPKHKFNSGMGATLCLRCGSIITTGYTDDLICKPCQKQALIDWMDTRCNCIDCGGTEDKHCSDCSYMNENFNEDD